MENGKTKVMKSKKYLIIIKKKMIKMINVYKKIKCIIKYKEILKTKLYEKIKNKIENLIN